MIHLLQLLLILMNKYSWHPCATARYSVYFNTKPCPGVKCTLCNKSVFSIFTLMPSPIISFWLVHCCGIWLCEHVWSIKCSLLHMGWHSYLFMPLLCKGKLTLTAQVTGVLLIRLRVGFSTGCRSTGAQVVRRDRWWHRITDKGTEGD